MSKIRELLRQGKYEQLWQMCCGFIDLSLEQFMTIQERLLLEQLELLNKCALGKKVMRGAMPETVAEFMEEVPLTTQADYYPELLERREDVLPVKPFMWVHTSGRSDQYPFEWIPIKWTPMSFAFYQELAKTLLACGIFASCKKKGDTSQLKEDMKFLYAVAPRPQTSGAFAYIVQEEISPHSLPPVAEAESLDFETRIRLGFQQALSRGLDFFFGVSIVLVAIGERFNQQSGKMDIRPLLSQPKALLRVAKGLVKSKLARRPLLPRDLWSVKGILGGGTDGAVFKETIKKLWGRYPLDVFVSTEGGVIATQTWDYDSMTFIPNLNFLEFIPEKEYSKGQLDHEYQPKTLLLDEVKPGEHYELVITNFHGGALVRYRTGDIVRITSLRNEKLGINIPQMAFIGKVDGIMDIGGFVRLSEKVIWQAIENTGIPYEDWTARKEVRGDQAVLNIYLELKNTHTVKEEDIATAIYEELKRLDDGFIYGDMNAVLNWNPVRVSLLPPGAFSTYTARRRAEGADLARLKPPHINPSENALSLLKATVQTVPEAESTAELAPSP